MTGKLTFLYILKGDISACFYRYMCMNFICFYVKSESGGKCDIFYVTQGSGLLKVVVMKAKRVKGTVYADYSCRRRILLRFGSTK